mgnify:CR=1 FL=1
MSQTVSVENVISLDVLGFIPGREPSGRLKKREGGTRTALQPSGVEVDLDALLNALEMRAGKHVGVVGVVHGHVR